MDVNCQSGAREHRKGHKCQRVRLAVYSLVIIIPRCVHHAVRTSYAGSLQETAFRRRERVAGKVESGRRGKADVKREYPTTTKDNSAAIKRRVQHIAQAVVVVLVVPWALSHL
jgi:hypothetical protein